MAKGRIFGQHSFIMNVSQENGSTRLLIQVKAQKRTFMRTYNSHELCLDYQIRVTHAATYKCNHFSHILFESQHTKAITFG